MKTGKVYLVGAGPGDPGLITQKGLEVLSRAEVIIYDNLIDKSLLQAAPPECELIFVGKTASLHIKEQSEINELLVQKALEGKVVVRLKGGDPLVLGRGGEEAEVLSARHIPFDIIPGITSAVAVPAYAGIPVTHRGKASSFAVITGHEDPSKENSSINWEKLATAVDTLVFLMGKQNLAAIMAKLEENGRDPGTPVAVIQNGTCVDQTVITGSLKNIAEKVKSQGLDIDQSPAVIVVGEVVSLREKLGWFDNRPLFGKRVLVTRAANQAGALSRLLLERGAQPLEFPVIEIQNITDYSKLDQAIDNFQQYHWTIFTSVNGIDSFFARLSPKGLDARVFSGVKIGVIGPATADRLRQKGLIPDFCPAVFTSQGVLDGFRSFDLHQKKVLLLRANIADESLSSGLAGLGAEVQDLTVYRTVPVKDTASRFKDLRQNGPIDVITFTSSSTVTNFMAALKQGGRDFPKFMERTRITCIGPKTAETAVKYGLKVDILAETQTIQGLVEAMEDYYLKLKEKP